LKILLPILTIFILTSCAGWRLEQTEKVGTFPSLLNSGTTQKLKVALNVLSYDHFYNGELKQSSLTETKKQEQIDSILQVYRDSDLFIFDKKNPDLFIDLEIKSEGSGSLNRVILTYATFFLIPSSSETKFSVKAVFKRANGEVIGEITKIDTVEKWQQLFLIFAMPFKYPYVALKDTLVDLNRAVIMEAFRDDYFREAID
tara:strand:+ start:8343 stop:8945 length:603 start_codon:yes stop_codon:yes gene_type:complete